MSELLVYARQWRAVMRAAGRRCQCRGECGDAHAKGDGRCAREHDQYASKRRGPVRLVAAPADPTLTSAAAARLPLSGLRAWCPECLDTTRRAARKTARAVPDAAQAGLFDL